MVTRDLGLFALGAIIASFDMRRPSRVMFTRGPAPVPESTETIEEIG